MGGYLSTGAFTLGTLFGVLYDDQEQALSFGVTGACQLWTTINTSGIRTTPRVDHFIPTGRTGLKLYSNVANMRGAQLQRECGDASRGVQPRL